MAKTVKPSKPDKATRLAQARVVKLFSEAKYTEAEALVRGQLLRQPRDLQAVHMMGSSLFGLDRNAAPLLWRLRAVVLQSLGRLDDAVKSYNQPLRCQPDFPAELLNSDALLDEMIRPDESLARFERPAGYRSRKRLGVPP